MEEATKLIIDPYDTTYYGDVLTVLPQFIDWGVKIRCCVTSPPYWKQKDFGHPDQIGQEETMEEYLENLLNVFGFVKELLTDDGSLWVNIDDCYNKSGGSGGDYGPGGLREGQPKTGPRNVKWLKAKELCGIPWRLAFAMQDRQGWYWRADNVWNKTNGATGNVTDRNWRAHEPVLHFTKDADCYFDLDATRQQAKTQEKRMRRHHYRGKSKKTSEFRPPNPKGPALRSSWIFPVANCPDAHFAVMPTDLPEICILQTSQPGDVILDPFMGSGTTAEVALRFGRRFLGIELNEKDYRLIIEKRITVGREDGRQLSLVSFTEQEPNAQQESFLT